MFLLHGRCGYISFAACAGRARSNATDTSDLHSREDASAISTRNKSGDATRSARHARGEECTQSPRLSVKIASVASRRTTSSRSHGDRQWGGGGSHLRNDASALHAHPNTRGLAGQMASTASIHQDGRWISRALSRRVLWGENGPAGHINPTRTTPMNQTAGASRLCAGTRNRAARSMSATPESGLLPADGVTGVPGAG